MKQLTLLIFIISSFSVLAQSNVSILYIDASENDNRLNAIIQKANNIINQSDDEFLLYIANGENPFVTQDQQEFDKTLKKIKRETINSPNLLDDVKAINSTMLSNSWVSDLFDGKDLINSISFVFIIEESNYHSFQFENLFIKQLLFSNNLYRNNMLVDKCSVSVFLDKDNSRISQNLNNKISFSYEYF
ncbi:MAG: hypothetical protein CBC71_01535 [Rhodobacteraceae bacterium TMED111]|nr:MAG: hypothetical protein CBC71_01535 [Rhodobacteraceae bacterium TMED111]|tara:strand:+ start:5080 stop:5646 length:567 start_codon:yes stop_codon:yes gene_type:complete